MIIVNQPAGLGDVIFSMTAIRRLNDKILWPVMPAYVEGLNRAYPDITFLDFRLLNINYNEKERYKVLDIDVIPLKWKDIPVQDCMLNKYKYFGLSWEIWKDDARYFRDHEREDALFNLLGLREGEKYNLISETFQADFKGRKDIKVENDYKNIYVTKTDGYSLFDWSKVFEQAATIHAVASSNIYLFELLGLQANEIKIYLRTPRETDHSHYQFLLKSHDYILE